MDLRRALRSINTEVRKPTINHGAIPMVRDLPDGEIEKLIQKVCSRYPGGLGYRNLCSCIGALTSCFGVSYEALEQNSGYFDQFVAAGSIAEIKTVQRVIRDMQKSFPNQVGAKMKTI